MLLTTEDGREFELSADDFKEFELRFGEHELVEFDPDRVVTPVFVEVKTRPVR